ncbi:MAG: sensor histidine kinase [Verrucomicrobiales bacterium]
MAAKNLMQSGKRSRLENGNRLPRSLFVLVLALTLIVFGAAISLMTLHLRSAMWHQLLQQDAEILNAAAVVQDTQFLQQLEKPEDALPALLSASTLRGVLAIRIFNQEGQFLSSFPAEVKQGNIAEDDLGLIRQGSTVSHYLQNGNISEVYEGRSLLAPVPMMRAIIPIRSESAILGAAEFLLDATHARLAFQNVDRDLLTHALGLWVAGSLVICPLMWWAYRKLQKTHLLLAKRSSDLLRANHELAMSAKTSAIGAVTAHLLHGIKNPLFGLQNFVSSHGSSGQEMDTSTWEAAADSARRIQAMINDIVRILNESENSECQYELTLEELGSILHSKFAAEASSQFKTLTIQVDAEGELQNHHANLAALILANLVQNALQAVAVGGTVAVQIQGSENLVECRVTDNGPGIPPDKQLGLFVPCRSSKDGGTGIGLAISKQLAHHMGAELALENSSHLGSCFILILPSKIFISQKEPLEQNLMLT